MRALRAKRLIAAGEEWTTRYGSSTPMAVEASSESSSESSGEDDGAEEPVLPAKRSRKAGGPDLTLEECAVGMEFLVARTVAHGHGSPRSDLDVAPALEKGGALLATTWCPIVGHRHGQLLCRIPDVGLGEREEQLVSIIGKKQDGNWLRPGGGGKRRTGVEWEAPEQACASAAWEEGAGAGPSGQRAALSSKALGKRRMGEE